MEHCSICNCELIRLKDEYAKPTIEGRSHATLHHYIAERLFGRSANRKGTQREAIFEKSPWSYEPKAGLFCYECHEELLHNPVLLPEDIEMFSRIVRDRELNEEKKKEGKEKIAGRIQLFHEVIRRGLKEIEFENGGCSQ